MVKYFLPASQYIYSRCCEQKIRNITQHQLSFLEPRPCFVFVRASLCVRAVGGFYSGVVHLLGLEHFLLKLLQQNHQLSQCGSKFQICLTKKKYHLTTCSGIIQLCDHLHGPNFTKLSLKLWQILVEIFAIILFQDCELSRKLSHTSTGLHQENTGLD